MKACTVRDSKKYITDSRGFSLIEILVVVAILGIALAIAVPSMARFVADWRVRDAVNGFNSHIRLARAEAIKSSRPVIICRGKLNGAGDDIERASPGCLAGDEWNTGWLVFVDNDLSGTYTTKDTILKLQGRLPGIKTFIQTNRGNLTFIPTGMLRASLFTSFNVQSSYESGGQPSKEAGICVASTGRTRVLGNADQCDPTGQYAGC